MTPVLGEPVNWLINVFTTSLVERSRQLVSQVTVQLRKKQSCFLCLHAPSVLSKDCAAVLDKELGLQSRGTDKPWTSCLCTLAAALTAIAKGGVEEGQDNASCKLVILLDAPPPAKAASVSTSVQRRLASCSSGPRDSSPSVLLRTAA